MAGNIQIPCLHFFSGGVIWMNNPLAGEIRYLLDEAEKYLRETEYWFSSSDKTSFTGKIS